MDYSLKSVRICNDYISAEIEVVLKHETIGKRKPLEAMFQGAQFMTYDLTKRGEPIYSSNDQLSMYFKTTQSSGLLFFTGDKQDYLTVSFKNGSVHVAVDLGSGAYNHMVNAGGFKLDDGQWHHLMVTRNSRKLSWVLTDITLVEALSSSR
ncbi:Neurexin-2 [Mactra antiquata]